MKIGKYILTALALIISVSAFPQMKMTEEQRRKIAAFENCFPQLSKPEPHRAVHDIKGVGKITTFDRSDFKYHRFQTADLTPGNNDIGIVDNAGLKMSDADIKEMLNDQFAKAPGFHLNAHGNQNGVIIDGRQLNARQTADLILDNLQNFNLVLNAKEDALPVVLHCCECAKGGENSFAAELSRILSKSMGNVTVIASDKVIESRNFTDGSYEEKLIGANGKEAADQTWMIFKNGKLRRGANGYKATMDVAIEL